MSFLTRFLLILLLGFSACISSTTEEDTPQSKGTRSALLTLSQIDSDSQYADINSEDIAFNFGAKLVGTTNSTIFTLTNSGDVPAKSISATTLTAPFSYAGGSYPGTEGTCEKSIPAQSTCTIALQYKPTELVSSESTVTIGYHNGKQRRTFKKPLSGTGYSAPTITVITPSTSFLTGGSTLTLTGTHLFTGVTVSIGGSTCSVNFTNLPTSLTCIIPAHAGGSVDVVVTNTDGNAATLSSGFTYVPPPVISSLSPSTGTTSGFTTVTINGTGFQNGATMTLGGESVPVTYVSSTQLTFLAPAHPSGSVNIVLTNPDTQTVTATSAYTYSTTAGEGWVRISTTGAPAARARIKLVWTGSQMIVWGSYNKNNGGIYDPISDTWTSTSTTNAPSVRDSPDYTWTGSKMLVWGGTQGGTLTLNTGGLFDPVSNTWSATNTTNAPPPSDSPAFAWTGAKMYFWGGHDYGTGLSHNNGGVYDPAANSWTSLPTLGALSPRFDSTGTYTGKEFIVHGGNATVGGYSNQGARYNPETDTWTNISTTNAPYTGQDMVSFWTGSKVLIWGNNIGNANTGKLYDPLTNIWTDTSTVGAPSQRVFFTSLWTGSKLIIWGGRDAATQFINTGGIFDPETNQWQTMTTLNSPAGKTSTIIGAWTGSKFIMWGGDEWGLNATNAGGVYTPPSPSQANSWTAMTTTGAPGPRMLNAAVWTGSEMIVWGGGWSPFYNDGARYNPVTNSWTTIATVSLAIRIDTAAVWTGSKMMIWGGSENSNIYNDGAMYDPSSNSWTSISTTGAPSPRSFSTLVWTGSKAIVWGGSGLNNGGIYNPQSDTWSAMSTANVASSWQRGVWTGSKMFLYAGLRANTYDPASDSWSLLATTNSTVASTYSASAWTGTKVIIWGGAGSVKINTGGVYDLTSNVWTSMTTVGAPEPCYRVGGVWTGKHFFVFGGDTGPNSNDVRRNTGGLYDPVSNQWTLTTTTGAPNPREFTHNLVWTGKSVITWGGPWVGFLNTGGIYTPP